MVFDPHSWTKKRIESLAQNVKDIKNDCPKTSPGEIWSIKKILVLDYYVSGFVKIIRGHPKFDRWFFVDTHCGTGLIRFKEDDFKEEIFPGSPLIAAFRNAKTPFTDYFFSDIDPRSISVLGSRLKKLKVHVGSQDYRPVARSFEDTVRFVKEHEKFGTAFLIFIDPVGFSEIRWDLMKLLLSIKTADIFFTFMTPFIALNQKQAKNNKATAETMTSFFGSEDWKDLSDGEELLQQYIYQIRKSKKYVFNIPIHQTGKRKLYDLIIATNSKGANNIIGDAKRIMDVTSTEIIGNALRVVARKQSDMLEFT